MMKHMDAILIWKGPTDKILLYHIKQVVLMANEVRYLFRSETKKLPWIKLIFYCVQYIKYFYATGNRNTLASLMSNDKLINYIKLWKIGLENMHDKEKWQDKKIQDMLQDFEDTYDSIRDIYTIDKMKKFSTIRTSFLNNLRILQVFGDCLKSTSQTPNISLRLKKYFKSHLGTDYENLIMLRDTISHLTGIPQCNQYDIKQVAKLTHTMESTLRKISDSIFNEFDSDYDSDSDNYIYDSQKDLIKTINQEINDAPKLSYYDCLKQLEDALNHNKEQGEIEMLLMIILNNLNQEQGRLNANREWFMEKYPTLTGQQLRNHLAHGDPIVELMDVDIKMAARHTAIMLIKELKMNDKNNKKIEKVTKRPAIEVMRKIDYQQITHLEKEKKLFQIIIEGDLEKFKDYLQNISSEWVNWQDLRKRNALHYAAANKKDNLELFQFVLEESSSYMKQIKTDSSLLFQASNNFKIAKRIVELHICALLENDRTYLQQNDNNDILELCKKLMKTEKIHSFWNVCYYQISCDNIENLKLLLDSIYYLSLKDLDYTVSGTGTMNFRMYRIASFYHAKEVLNYLINIGYAINYPNINHQEIHTYSNTEKYNELREIIKSGQVFKVKEHKEIDVMNSLHFAVQSRNSEIVKQVYQCLPVLLFKKNNEDKTPLDVAVNENRVKEFNVLIEQAINNSSNQLQMFKTLANEIINLRESNIFRDNKGVAENVLSNTIYAMKMNPEEKSVQYWAIKLAQSMLGYYESNEHLLNIWKQKAINTLFHFSDESHIVTECIDFVVEIFDHKWRAQPKYNIADQLETILCAKYDHSSIILEKLNIALQNKIEYGHWSKIIAHHAKYAIETFTDDPHIQRYAIKLIYHLHKSGTDLGVYDLCLRTSLKKVLSVFENGSTVHICCYLIGFYLICYESTKLEETDNKIKSEMNYFNLEDEWEIYFKNLVIRHFEFLEYDWLTYAVKTQFMPYNNK
ncbi:uncharacterized protein [Atheta coriaria]|uniref:uncharacterized protein n=1 Tax=Dalotia coriaria TaxID=877792 RepID=UPI0031F46242